MAFGRSLPAGAHLSLRFCRQRDAGPDSDYDILVVVRDDAPAERRRSRLAYEVLWGAGAAADVLVWSLGQFESRVHVASSLPATVIREGKLLHAA